MEASKFLRKSNETLKSSSEKTGFKYQKSSEKTGFEYQKSSEKTGFEYQKSSEKTYPDIATSCLCIYITKYICQVAVILLASTN